MKYMPDSVLAHCTTCFRTSDVGMMNSIARYKPPVSVLVVIHTPNLDILLLERALHPGYWQFMDFFVRWHKLIFCPRSCLLSA
jgi:hypothetical protein